MSETITVTNYSLVSDPEWERDLIEAKEKFIGDLIPPFIEFCKAVNTFRMRCDSSRGGSEFNKRGCELLGCSSTQLYHWSAVGLRSTELLGASNKLPLSHDAIQRIASLDDIAFPKALQRLEPGMTNQQVRVLIKEVNPPIARTAFEPEDRERRKLSKLIAEIYELQESYRRLIWDHLNDEFKEDETGDEASSDSAICGPIDWNSPEWIEFLRKCDENIATLKSWLNYFGISKDEWCGFQTIDDLLKITAPIILDTKSSASKAKVARMVEAEENLIASFPGWHD